MHEKHGACWGSRPFELNTQFDIFTGRIRPGACVGISSTKVR